MKIIFVNGLTIEASGPYRILHHNNKWYVIGNNEVIKMLSSDECNEFIWAREENKLTWAGKKVNNI